MWRGPSENQACSASAFSELSLLPMMPPHECDLGMKNIVTRLAGMASSPVC